MRQLELPSDSKYRAVWIAFPPLGHWLDSLPEVTTLATIQTWVAKLAERWAEVSADSDNRLHHSGASIGECIWETGEREEHFAGLLAFLEAAYGPSRGSADVVDSLIARLREYVDKLIAMYGSGVPIQQIQTLQKFPSAEPAV